MKCACCGKTLSIIGVQTYPTKYNLAPKTLVECQNERCVAHRWTATTETHHEACEKARAEAVRKGASA